jgi:hypothetical protein
MRDLPTYRDPKTGDLIRYRYTRDAGIPDCPLCAADRCVQRVESSDAWEADVIIHGAAEDLS